MHTVHSRTHAHTQANLIKLVHSGAGGSKLLQRTATDLKYPIQQLSVVDLDDKGPQLQTRKDLGHDSNALSIREHWVIVTSNVEILRHRISTYYTKHKSLYQLC